MSKHALIKVFCCIILAVSLCGCEDAIFWFWDHVAFEKCSVWRKGDIYFEGMLNEISKKREFVRLYVGNPAAYAEELPPIYIEWPNGEKILLSTISADILTKMDCVKKDGYGIATFPTRKDSPREFWYWPDGTQYYTAHCYKKHGIYDVYAFAVIENRIVGFMIYGDSECFAFWNESLTKRYAFPLTQEEVEELFGQPDEIEDSVCF